MTTIPKLALRDGSTMPALGLGTWKSRPGEVRAAVRAAIEVGYRHIDCAAIYGNEAEVGGALRDAIAAGDVTREELFITSKLWNDAHLADDVRPALEATLGDLGLDHLDLYLVHWPIAFVRGVSFAQRAREFLTLDQAPLERTWEAMLAQRQAGRVRNVGVSNMGPARLAQLAAVGDPAADSPAVVQVECHPHLQQEALRAECKARGIVLTAYSPLGSTDRQGRKADEPALLAHPTILALAEALCRSPAQILLAWSLARGNAVIPKSVHRERIAENLLAAEVQLRAEDLAAIAAMDAGYRYLDGEFFARAGSPYRAADIWR